MAPEPTPPLTAEQRRELTQTAAVFEMIAEANPADVSALEALSEIYAKLGEQEKLAAVSARLRSAPREPAPEPPRPAAPP
ncbi:MAG TPA: hypothetical protein VNO23_03370, partial [Candidatus Binatia bacterium]|nr:hypothetical protein [Candidatus Binatia bacterium]